MGLPECAQALRIELFEPTGATETVYWDDVAVKEIPANELAGDAGRGAGAYARRCANCHELDTNQRGPQLRNIYGTWAAQVSKFFYSDALKKANLIWNDAVLEKWLSSPDTLVPNNDMHYGADGRIEGLDIIAYLKQLSIDSPHKSEKSTASIVPEQLERHRAVMKNIGDAIKRLKPEVDAKLFRKASNDAFDLQSAFRKVDDFWAKANTADAAQLSKDGVSAIEAILAAAKDENADQLSAGFKKLTATCGGCHASHRDKLADGTFGIK